MTGRELLDKHLANFSAGDVDALAAEYAEDVVFFTQGGVVRGRDNVKPILAAVLEEFSDPSVTFELLANDADGQHAYIAWKATTPKNEYLLGTDTFVVKDGHIVMQSSAVATKPR